MIQKERREMILVCTDFHVPFQDEKSLAALYEFIMDNQPDKIILHEIDDFYQLSKYSKNPARKDTLAENIKSSNLVRASIRKAAGKDCEMIELGSNHMERFKKYIWDRAKELDGLIDLNDKFEHKKHNIKYFDDYVYRGILFKHGSIIRKGSSLTAKAEFDKEGMSGCSGHSHRLGTYFKRLRGGSYVWLECGCLCHLDNIEYVEGTADWQQGFGVFFFEKGSNRFTPGVIPIIDHKIFFDGKLYYEKRPGEVAEKLCKRK